MKKGRSDKARFIHTWKFLIVLQIILFAGFVLQASSERSASQTSEQKNMKISSFDGVTIIVKDYEAQKKFYRGRSWATGGVGIFGRDLFQDQREQIQPFRKGHHKDDEGRIPCLPRGV
jgi:hypothetical protein